MVFEVNCSLANKKPASVKYRNIFSCETLDTLDTSHRTPSRKGLLVLLSNYYTHAIKVWWLCKYMYKIGNEKGCHEVLV